MSQASAQSVFGKLSQYLSQDPDNLHLIADTATAAVDEGELDAAAELLGRYEDLAPLTPSLLNLRGIAALGSHRPGEAADAFGQLLAQGHNQPEVTYNAACAAMLMKQEDRALELLDDTVIEAMPAAAALRIRAMHRLGLLAEALSAGGGYAERFPEDAQLMSALASVALDLEDGELARFYALKAGGTAEGLSALGMLTIQNAETEQSLALFNQALGINPDNARANLGKGLALLSRGEAPAALPYLDHAAELFDTHLGSWVTAAWGYFTLGDYKTSRARFEAALVRDDTFSEIHGGLAVLDACEGDLQSARRRTEIALRLDPQSGSGALAKSLLLVADGKPRLAEEVQARALETPMGPQGETLREMMLKMAHAGKLASH